MVFGRPSFVMFPPALSVGVGKAPREETVGVCGQGNLSRLIGGPMTACDAVDGSHPPASRCHVLESPNRTLLALFKHQEASG